jgi:hypothetical protein
MRGFREGRRKKASTIAFHALLIFFHALLIVVSDLL